MAQKVAGRIAWLGALEGCFSRLEFRFDGLVTGKRQQRDIRHPQRGSGIQYRGWQRLQPVQYKRTCATKVQWHARSFDQAFGARNIIGGSRMLKRFDFQAIVLVPLAGTSMEFG